jgi:hypothetical protein
MFPNIAISLLGSLLPAIINSAGLGGVAPAHADNAVKRASGAGVTVPNVNMSLIGMLASTAIATLGAAGFGDITHTAMLVLGGVGAIATALGHSNAISASDNNTLSTIGTLLTQISQLQADNVSLGGSGAPLAAGTAPDVVLTAEPARMAPAPSDASPIGSIS